MNDNPATFGRFISIRRKAKSMSQKDLAGKILREDSPTSISPQYLNDIEHDRRSPSSDYLIKQLAQVLEVEEDYLYYLAGRIPSDVAQKPVTQAKIQEALLAFRKVLEHH